MLPYSDSETHAIHVPRADDGRWTSVAKVISARREMKYGAKMKYLEASATACHPPVQTASDSSKPSEYATLRTLHPKCPSNRRGFLRNGGIPVHRLQGLVTH